MATGERPGVAGSGAGAHEEVLDDVHQQHIPAHKEASRQEVAEAQGEEQQGALAATLGYQSDPCTSKPADGKALCLGASHVCIAGVHALHIHWVLF